MGINNLLPNLPGGRTISFCCSFYGLGMGGDVISLDATVAIWQFAASLQTFLARMGAILALPLIHM